MTEKRFGSLDTFVEVGDWTYRMGRPVANEGFLTALLTQGTFDTYEFFCPDLHHMDAFMQRVEELVPDSTCLARVRPSLQIALPESLQTTEYFAFHMGDFTYAMPRLVALRNRLAPEPFPVTGITHSLDAVGMTLRYLELAPFRSRSMGRCCLHQPGGRKSRPERVRVGSGAGRNRADREHTT